MRSSTRVSTKALSSRVPAGMRAVRIIGGQWRRTPLQVVAADGLRPTPDRVRETVFNWLTHCFEGSLEGVSVLDLFAGTGALGFEAASRGARRVVLVENQPLALRALAAAKEKLSALQIDIIAGDAGVCLERLRREGERFDIVFLDPPFNAGWLERTVGPVAGLLSDKGHVYIESEKAISDASVHPFGLEVVRADKAGQVFYHLLQRQIILAPGEVPVC